MATPVEQIKEKLDILEFLKGYLTVTPAGKNFKAPCPFHKEKTPSFMISPDRQSWHCFGCGLGGDVFSFLMRIENLEFSEALRVLAEKAGIELRRLSPAEYRATGILYDLQDAAAKFFQNELKKAKVAEEYLLNRKLKQETIETFGLGWAPNSQDGLVLNLLNQGFAVDDLVRAGLALQGERGGVFDRFRGRVMFPIHNSLGRVVGFTGRILPQIEKSMMEGGAVNPPAKYVNSPETPIFVKSKVLYGFWKTKDAIRENNSAFLVEGQMDFLMSWQAGVKNAVASSGTAFTADHLRLLRRLTDEIVLSFDADEAGWSAGERAVELAEENDFGVKVVMLQGFKDPADAVADNPENLVKAIESAEPAVSAYWRHYLGPVSDKSGGAGNINFGDRENLRRLRIILGKVRHIASAVNREYWLEELSRKTGLAKQILSEEMTKMEMPSGETRVRNLDKESYGKATAAEAEGEPVTRWAILTEEVLSLLRGREELGELKEEELSPGYGDIFRVLLRGNTRDNDQLVDKILERIVLKSRDAEPSEIEFVVQELRSEYRKKTRERLTLAVRAAEARGDQEQVESIMKEIMELR